MVLEGCEVVQQCFSTLNGAKSRLTRVPAQAEIAENSSIRLERLEEPLRQGRNDRTPRFIDVRAGEVSGDVEGLLPAMSLHPSSHRFDADRLEQPTEHEGSEDGTPV